MPQPQPRRVPSLISHTLLLVAAVGLMAGCGSEAVRSGGSESRGESSHNVVGETAAQQPDRTPATPIAEGSAVTMSQLVGLASEHNATRALFDATRAAARAQVDQSGAWANPEIEARGGRARGRDGTGSTSIGGIEASQRFELPGKRSSRVSAAQAGQEVAEREVAVDALDLEREVRDAGVALAVATRFAEIADQTAKAATQTRELVARKADAGEADQGDLSRAKLDEITITINRDARVRAVDNARAALRLWCGHLPQTFTISDALPNEPATLTLDAAEGMARENNPLLRLYAAQASARAADVQREQRAWYPDVTVGAFADREADSDNLGILVGVELPLWNRNQGGIAAAESERARVLARARIDGQALQREVRAAWSEYESQRLAIVRLSGEAQPAAAQALGARVRAYEAGEATVLEVLEARRAAQSVDESVIEARRSAAEAFLRLGRAIGTFTLATAPAGDRP
jgi:cobalt-zinc-cadmium efflux system outer membrane protein